MEVILYSFNEQKYNIILTSTFFFSYSGLVEQITPLNLKNIRQILNSSAMDIMYYTSPIYGREIQNSLANELNRLHSEFVERHPHHHFKVSIMAHSLGSVISYDIITGWEPFVSNFEHFPCVCVTNVIKYFNIYFRLSEVIVVLEFI